MADLKKVRLQLIDVNTGEPIEDVDVLTSAKAVLLQKDGTETDLQTYLNALVLQKGDNGVTYDWLNGTSNPAAAAGKVGDWYINTATFDIYKKTAASTWTLQCNIKGAVGDKGDTGAQGTLIYMVTTAITSAPAGARVNDLVVNGGTGSLTVGGKSLAIGDYAPITTLSPLALGAVTGNLRGAQGATGAAGTSAYVHIRWGASATPATLLTSPAEYIGIATTSSATAPATHTGYTWYKYKGEPGDLIKMGTSLATAKDVKLFMKVVE